MTDRRIFASDNKKRKTHIQSQKPYTSALCGLGEGASFVYTIDLAPPEEATCVSCRHIAKIERRKALPKKMFLIMWNDSPEELHSDEKDAEARCVELKAADKVRKQHLDRGWAHSPPLANIRVVPVEVR